jgi:hypothetical protein
MKYFSDHERIVRLEKKLALLEHRLGRCIANSRVTTMAIGHPLENTEVLSLNKVETLNTVRSGEKQNGFSTTETVEPPEIPLICPCVKNALRFPNDLSSE